MTQYELTQVQAQPYLFAEGESSMDPDEIGAAMGQTYQKVLSHMQAHGIEPQGAPPVCLLWL